MITFDDATFGKPLAGPGCGRTSWQPTGRHERFQGSRSGRIDLE